MTLSNTLAVRSESKCELCSASNELSEYTVSPKSGDNDDEQVVVCTTCLTQIENPDQTDVNHWRCLNESMWSQVPSVQVMSYRMLDRLKENEWAQDLLGMIYMDDKTLEWAKMGSSETAIVHKDSNGHILQSGDNVTLIQDLNVKGSSLTAKRGVAVRRIRLDPNNAEYIEGKVDGQHIVILTKYVKKSN